MKRPTGVWDTITPIREVLAVARSVPAVGRLLDVSALLADDRVGLTFTTNPGSRSEDGVAAALRSAGVERVIPWEQAVERAAEFDLALAASAKGDLHRLGTPLVLMPHGAGYNRRVGAAPGSLSHAAGIDASQLVHDGHLVPTRVVLSHTEQVRRLEEACPPAAGYGVVVGDPAFDRMLAAQGRRERYRDALHVGDRRLVVVSSTWNRSSLLGAQRDTVRALLAELPQDENRVALVAHPNIWHQRGRAQLELWFADEIEAGLVLIPPFEGWRAALIAADLVIGDVGSTTYYAAALGRPVLLAAFGTTDLDPRSPLVEFGTALPRLEPGELAAQVDHAAGLPSPAVAELMIEHPHGSAERLQALLYSLLALPEPEGQARYLPLPDLPDRSDDPTAWQVVVDVSPDGPGAPVLTVRRFPAGASTADPGHPLVVDAEDTTMPRWGSADAWSRRRRATERQAVVWLRERLAAYPKADLATASVGERSAFLLHRSGRAMRVHDDSGPLDAAVLAAAVSGWTRAGWRWQAWNGRLRVRVGDRTLLLRALPPPPADLGFLGERHVRWW